MESEEEFFGFDDQVIKGDGCKIVPSNRGGLKLSYDGYIYYQDSEVKAI